MNRRFSFGKCLGNDHALAGGQAICLDDDRYALFMNIGNGRVDVGEVAILRRGNAMAVQEVFRECLGAFQLRSVL